MKAGLFLISLMLAGCTVLSGCQQTTSVQYIDPDDPLTGWYVINSPPSKYQSPDIIIPVFKFDGIYYSVCRGAEIPFKQTPEGLQWALEPSSMVGTTISYQVGQHFIVIKDRMRASVQEETSESIGKSGFQLGGATPMTRVKKPSHLLDPTTTAPRSNDDFVGVYQPAWFPYYRLEIRKDGEKYLAAYQEIDQDGVFQNQGKSVVLTSLSDRLGLGGLFGKKESTLTYNETLRRYETVHGTTGSAIKIPQVRIDVSSETNSVELPQNMRIGIPSWH